jgi:hypothetical protein
MAILISFSLSFPDEPSHNLAGRTAKPLGFTLDKIVLNERERNMEDKAQMQQGAGRGGSAASAAPLVRERLLLIFRCFSMPHLGRAKTSAPGVMPRFVFLLQTHC